MDCVKSGSPLWQETSIVQASDDHKWPQWRILAILFTIPRRIQAFLRLKSTKMAVFHAFCITIMNVGHVLVHCRVSRCRSFNCSVSDRFQAGRRALLDFKSVRCDQLTTSTSRDWSGRSLHRPPGRSPGSGANLRDVQAATLRPGWRSRRLTVLPRSSGLRRS
jgi:hypothetical protein